MNLPGETEAEPGGLMGPMFSSVGNLPSRAAH
jgi:hypothetical protein